MSIYDPPEGYEYDVLIITVDGGYERDRTVEARECSRCGAVVITLEAHNQRCPLKLLCDGCGQVGADRETSDDGRGLFCPSCLAKLTGDQDVFS